MKKITFLLIVIFLLTSCGDVGKVLRNEKIKSTDEFLVKKKGPLVLPPDFNKIPEPGSAINKSQSDEEKIKQIIKTSNKNNKVKNKSSTLEGKILKNIRK
tara:strand:- start:139 stop:438 length:300 start_codon:yes stop_codon:yes gene_type:complete